MPLPFLLPAATMLFNVGKKVVTGIKASKALKTAAKVAKAVGGASRAPDTLPPLAPAPSKMPIGAPAVPLTAQFYQKNEANKTSDTKLQTIVLFGGVAALLVVVLAVKND